MFFGGELGLLPCVRSLFLFLCDRGCNLYFGSAACKHHVNTTSCQHGNWEPILLLVADYSVTLFATVPTVWSRSAVKTECRACRRPRWRRGGAYAARLRTSAPAAPAHLAAGCRFCSWDSGRKSCVSGQQCGMCNNSRGGLPTVPPLFLSTQSSSRFFMTPLKRWVVLHCIAVPQLSNSIPFNIIAR